MKWNYITITFFLSLTASSCHRENTKCTEDIDPDCFCTLEYDPVCGCNDKTYSNACHADCAGIKEYTPGECPDVTKPTIFGDWNFIGYLNEDGIDLDLPVKKHPYEVHIVFLDETNLLKKYVLTGKSSVNTYSGLYSFVPPYVINISDLVTTEIAGSPDAMAFETKYYQALDSVETYDYYKEVLLVTTGFNAGKDRMVFVKRA